jgi:hypothetical protein
MTEVQWLACTNPGSLLMFREGHVTDRQRRLFAIACCLRIKHWITDPRSRQALELCEAHAEGLASQDDLTEALALARAAQQSTWQRVAELERQAMGGRDLSAEEWLSPAGRQALEGARLAVILRAADYLAADDAAGAVTYAAGQDELDTRGVPPQWTTWPEHSSASVARAVMWEAVWHHLAMELGTAWEPVRDAAFGEERRCHGLLMHDILGNPFRPVAIHESWLRWNGGTIVQLAHAAYDERSLPSGTLDNGRLVLLADALEDSGCTDPVILDHCRGPGPHVRGCFVADALLNKP